MVSGRITTVTKSPSPGFTMLVPIVFLYPKYRMKKIGMLMSVWIQYTDKNSERKLKQPTGSEKTRNIEFPKENSQAIDEGEDGRPCTTPIRQVRLPRVRLPRVVVGILPDIEFLFFHSSI